MFSSLLNQTAFFTPISTLKTSMNRTSTVLLTSSAISIPCYITEISFSPISMGKDVIKYTHLIYTDYRTDILDTDNFVIVVDNKQYQIEETMKTYGNHHLEFGATIIQE